MNYKHDQDIINIKNNDMKYIQNNIFNLIKL